MAQRPAVFLKRALLAFWAAWFTVVFATNLLDGARHLGLLSPDWPGVSGNYEAVAGTTAKYQVPPWVNAGLFAGVICWEAVAAILFWLAWHRYRGKGVAVVSLYAAFSAGLGLWAAFLLADEAFIAYPLEGTHLRLFVAQLVTLLAIELLPEERTAEPSSQ